MVLSAATCEARSISGKTEEFGAGIHMVYTRIARHHTSDNSPPAINTYREYGAIIN
jgi:hypothetical protein